MITNGTITIEDGTKAKEEYAPARKVSVSITFSVPEGVTESAQSKIYLDTAASLADAKVREMLGRGPISNMISTEIAKKIVEPAKPGRKKKEDAGTKAEQAEKLGLPTTDIVSKGNPPSQIDIEEIIEDMVPEAPEDDIDDLLGDSAPAPVTDAELAKAAQTKNGLMKQKAPDTWQPTKIRELIAEYAGQPPKKITDIPSAKRREFLLKLEALS